MQNWTRVNANTTHKTNFPTTKEEKENVERTRSIIEKQKLQDAIFNSMNSRKDHRSQILFFVFILLIITVIILAILGGLKII